MSFDQNNKGRPKGLPKDPPKGLSRKSPNKPSLDALPSDPSKTSLVRTSTLDPVYLNENINHINTLVKLLFKDNIKSMTQGWTPTEIENHRRLVKFKFERVSASEYVIEFEKIDKKDFDHTSPIISCIGWKEKDIFVVTSVDIIVILEYLVRQSFSIEEKNRIRRNLQSLKPLTVTRLSEEHKAFFSLLMSMEDPRPRNIEQDLKVFKWENLSTAINKVIAKYSIVDEYAEPTEIAESTNSGLLHLLATEPATEPASRMDDECGQLKKEDYKLVNNFNNSNNDVFIPSERIKVLKRKLNQGRSSKSTKNDLLKEDDEDRDDQDPDGKHSNTNRTNTLTSKTANIKFEHSTASNESSTFSQRSYSSENNGSSSSSASSLANSQGASIFSNLNYSLDSQNLSASRSFSLYNLEQVYKSKLPKQFKSDISDPPMLNHEQNIPNNSGPVTEPSQSHIPNYFQYPETSVLYNTLYGPIPAHRPSNFSGNPLSISNMKKLDNEYNNNENKQKIPMSHPKKVTLPSIGERLSIHSNHGDNRLAPLFLGPNSFSQSVDATQEQKKNTKLLPGTKQIHRYLIDSQNFQSTLSGRSHTPFQKYS